MLWFDVLLPQVLSVNIAIKDRDQEACIVELNDIMTGLEACGGEEEVNVSVSQIRVGAASSALRELFFHCCKLRPPCLKLCLC
jgi:hypothetical protein